MADRGSPNFVGERRIDLLFCFLLKVLNYLSKVSNGCMVSARSLVDYLD